MRSRVVLFLFVLFLLRALPAMAAGLPPWQFGMSASDIEAFRVYGPYRSFSNGDLETFNGQFGDRKVNAQFFLKDNKLRRIGVYVYEGQNLQEAKDAWRWTYDVLKSAYGDIEVPNIVVDPSQVPPSADALATAAAAHTEVIGKTRMAPQAQPSDLFVFCSFTRHDVKSQKVYTVVVNLDQRP